MPGSGPDYCLILIERECICHVMHPLCFSKPDKVCHRCMRCVSCILSSVGNLTINVYICPILRDLCALRSGLFRLVVLLFMQPLISRRYMTLKAEPKTICVCVHAGLQLGV